MRVPRLLVSLLLGIALPALAAAVPDDEPKVISSVIVRIDQRPAKEFEVTLQNGQVWQQADHNTQLELKRGDRIVLRKSGLSSFVLVAPNGASVRVKRVR